MKSKFEPIDNSQEFFQIPTSGIIRRGISFSRSTLLRLAKFGKLKSMNITVKRDSSKGISGKRLFLLQSLDEFIDSQVAQNMS